MKTDTPEAKAVRSLRVGEQARHALSDILARGDVHDPVLEKHLVTITEVRMSPDLRHAAVFVKPLLGKDEEKVLKALAPTLPTSSAKSRTGCRCGMPPS